MFTNDQAGEGICSDVLAESLRLWPSGKNAKNRCQEFPAGRLIAPPDPTNDGPVTETELQPNLDREVFVPQLFIVQNLLG